MEYWLKCGKDSIQLPIRPGAFEVSQENTHQTVNVQTLGNVSILGKRGLKAFSLKSFFPPVIILLQITQRTETLGTT